MTCIHDIREQYPVGSRWETPLGNTIEIIEGAQRVADRWQVPGRIVKSSGLRLVGGGGRWMTDILKPAPEVDPRDTRIEMLEQRHADAVEDREAMRQEIVRLTGLLHERDGTIARMRRAIGDANEALRGV